MRNTRAWFAIGLAGAVAIAAPISASGAFRIAPGDLLVADLQNQRILAVDRDTGAVQDFSPRAGSGPNLLVAPGDLVSLADGSVYVVDQGADQLVRIDAATGAQSVVQNCAFDLPPICFPAIVGDVPRGIDVAGPEPTFFVATTKMLLRVRYESAPLFKWTSEPQSGAVWLGTPRGLAYYAYEGAERLFTATEDGMLVYATFSTGLLEVGYDPPAQDAYVTSVATSTFGFVMFTELQADPGGCVESASAVRMYDGLYLTGPFDVAVGGELHCPEAIAVHPFFYPLLFVADDRPGTPGSARLLRIDTETTPATVTVLAPLPDGAAPTTPSAIALYAPEPSRSLAEIAALAALAWCRPRWHRRMWRARTLAPSLALAFALGAAPASAFPLGRLDLLVADVGNGRILAVDRQTGEVQPFSPGPESGENLLVAPGDLVSLADGTVYVVDQGADQLVRIDAATGSQSVVQNCIPDFPPICTLVSIGEVPRGLEVLPGSDADPVLYALATDELRQLHYEGFPTFAWSSTPLATAPGAGAFRGAAYLEADGVRRIFTAVEDGRLAYAELDPGGFGAVYTPLPGSYVTSAATWAMGQVLFSERRVDGSGGCDGSAAAVRAIDGVSPGVTSDVLLGTQAELHCLEAIAVHPLFPSVFWLADDDPTTPGSARVLQVLLNELDPPTVTVLAPLPDAGAATIPAAITFYTPEPEAGLSALGAFAALARRRRTASRRRERRRPRCPER